MFKLCTFDRRKKTQTRPSAFFCIRRKSEIQRIAAIAVIFIVGALLSTHANSLEGEKPKVHLKGLSFKSMDWGSRIAHTELSIVVDNPGPAIKLKDLSYRLKLNDQQAAEGKYDKEVELPANGSTTLKLPCAIDLSSVPGVAWAVVSGGFDVRYQFDSEFTIPLFPPLSPRIKTSIAGDLSLTETVSDWSARIKERISGN